MQYAKNQRLNDWVEMLHSIYGSTANYASSEYEILAHLTEVTGAFGKYFIKKSQSAEGIKFLPKMFVWGIALLKKVKGSQSDLEEILLIKYPRVCPYCAKCPCACEAGKKGTIDEAQIREAFFRNANLQKRSLNDFQLMFRSIYQDSWRAHDSSDASRSPSGIVHYIYVRLTEELSEIAEAMRFHHLYPSNFDNELADYFAWWYALLSSVNGLHDESLVLLAENLIWPTYPGICPVCLLPVCDCRPGPVREILSKPSLLHLASVDGLTQTSNDVSFVDDVNQIESGALPFPIPISCIKIDIDNLKRINEKFSRKAGDDALKHVVTTIRQKSRLRDRIYRVGGDEFVIICPDLSALEAKGMMSRVADVLKSKPLQVSWGSDQMKHIVITLSVGVAVCSEVRGIKSALELADFAAQQSAAQGQDRIM